MLVGQQAVPRSITGDEKEPVPRLPGNPIASGRPRGRRIRNAIGAQHNRPVASDTHLRQAPFLISPVGISDPLTIGRPRRRTLIALDRWRQQRDRGAARGLRDPDPERPDWFMAIALIRDAASVR